MQNLSVMSHDDIFDDITLAEDRFHSEGYTDGLVVGAIGGYKDGHGTGVDQGNKIGSEVGFYRGFVSISRRIMERQNKNESKLKHLDAMMELLNAFDLMNVHNPTFMEDLEKIRGKFKQVSANLGVNPQFGKSGVQSF